MYELHIEHRIEEFDDWKKAFDSDPLGRLRSGVRRYRVMRATDDPHLVIIDLEFDGYDAAEEFAGRLHELWGRTDGPVVVMDPQIRIGELIESRELGLAAAAA